MRELSVRTWEVAPVLDVVRPEDSELIKRFLGFLDSQGKSKRLMYKRSWELRKVSELLGKPFANAEPADIEELARSINRATIKRGKNILPASEAYKFDLYVATKSFYQWFLKSKNPALLENFVHKKPKPALLMPSKLIAVEEASRMVNATPNLMEQALIATLYSTGARIGELQNMRVRDVFIVGSELQIRLDGKTGERIIPVGLPMAVSKLTEYWQSRQGDSSEPLWIGHVKRKTVSYVKPLSYKDIRDVLNRVNDLAGIGKRVNPHSWRHARATELAKHLTDQQLKYYFGWTASSNMTGRYIHADQSIVSEKFAELYGKQDDTRIDASLAVVLHSMALYLQEKQEKTRFDACMDRKGTKEQFYEAITALKSIAPVESVPPDFSHLANPAGETLPNRKKTVGYQSPECLAVKRPAGKKQS